MGRCSFWQPPPPHAPPPDHPRAPFLTEVLFPSTTKSETIAVNLINESNFKQLRS